MPDDLETAQYRRKHAAVHCRGLPAWTTQLSRPTIDAIQRLMLAAGLSTDGKRPQFRDIYERAPDPPKKP